MTDAIVLAAGLGRRLAAVTALPKWLTPVNDSCPADPHLAAFEQAGIERVLVVVSPGANPIQGHVAGWTDRLSIELVINPHAADRNNWYSLVVGLDAWLGTDGDDMVVVNSDLYADPAWFVELLARITGSAEPAALAVDRARGRTDEAMKVGLDASDRVVTAIGKVGVDDPGGEYVGLSWWQRSAAAELHAILAAFESDADRVDHWYEHGIQEHLRLGARYEAIAVPDSRWVEIDDESDLAAARALSSVRG